jgi:hypothetical protein
LALELDGDEHALLVDVVDQIVGFDFGDGLAIERVGDGLHERGLASAVLAHAAVGVRVVTQHEVRPLSSKADSLSNVPES